MGPNDSDSEESCSLSTSGYTSSSVTSYDATNSLHTAFRMSVISLNSDMVLYKQQYGRIFNNHSDVYFLPADEEEFARLELQHEILCAVFGQIYPSPMSEVLAKEEGPAETKTCLDLGCGNGGWMLDVALDFPHVQVVGIDLIPPPIDNMPQNLRSEVDDINLGLDHYFGDYNVVHARLISSGIQDYHRLVDQLANVVRPGGLLCLSESDFCVYDVAHQPIDFHDSSKMREPWWGQWLHLLRDAIKTKGGDLDAANHIHEWVSQNPLWEKVTNHSYWIPVVPEPRVGPVAGRSVEIDDMMKSNVISFLRSGRPLLLEHGLTERLVKILEENATKEIHDRLLPQFVCLRNVTARRKLP